MTFHANLPMGRGHIDFGADLIGVGLTLPSLHSIMNQWLEPASVAMSDACSTGDQELAGSIPAESSSILSWRFIMKYFL